jgi:hypothetical protein
MPPNLKSCSPRTVCPLIQELIMVQILIFLALVVRALNTEHRNGEELIQYFLLKPHGTNQKSILILVQTLRSDHLL